MNDTQALEPIARAICDAGGYRLLGYVGEGAFKVTFQVEDSEGALQALKVYHSRAKGDRIEREIDAMRQCDHPNLVRVDEVAVHSTGEHEYLYSLEEFIPGVTLEQRLNESLLEVEEVAELARILADSLAHIAAQGFVHRDIKPANIILREGTGAPVIVDFGLVRDLHATSLTATWIPRGPGTPFYASPEQLNNEKHLIDWRSDQFTLGIVLVECATGTHPFAQSGDQPSDIIDKVAARWDLPGWLNDWALRSNLDPLVDMVQAWPVRRYREPGDLIAAWKRSYPNGGLPSNGPPERESG